MIDLDAIHDALAPTRRGLEAAGFDFSLADDGGRLRLTVIAGAEACEECLVPKSLFRQMALDEIRAAGHDPIELDISYPVDARRSKS